MDNIKRVNMVLDYIEQNICEDLDGEEISKISCCSFQQFQRIFSYVAEMSLYEYIRKRKLTIAAINLKNNQQSITDVAIQYGYETHSGFSRAFKIHHNATPTEIIEGIKEPKIFNRLFFLKPSSTKSEIYRVEKGETKMARLTHVEFKSFGPYKVIGRAFNTKLMSNDIPMLWGKFFSDGSFETLLELCGEEDNLTNLPDAVNGVMYNFKENGSMTYLVGIIFSVTTKVPEGFDSFDLPNSMIIETQITGEEYEIYAQGHDLTVDAVKSSDYTIDWENFYQCEVYTEDRFQIPKRGGETILTLDYYIPVK